MALAFDLFLRSFTQGPTASSTMPPATALDGSAGSSMEYARADHTHAAKIQRFVVTTGADGTATWTFARPFNLSPAVTYMVEDTTGEPVIVSILSKSTTSVQVKAFKSRKLPAVIGLLSTLVNFDLFGGAGISGLKINLFAAEPTQ